MLRGPEPFALPTWTILGGVYPLPCSGTDGELFLTIFSPGARLGVSRPGLLFVLTDRLKRGCALLSSFRGGDDGTGPASASSACVTLENLIAGGGSSSESLSSSPNRFVVGAFAVKPVLYGCAESGEFLRICGRLGCATAAMMRLTFAPRPVLLLR